MFPSVYLKKDSSESDVQLSIMNRQSTFLLHHRKNISTFARMNVRTEEKRCVEKYCVDRRFVRSTLLMFPMTEFGSYVLVLQWTEARVSNFFSDRHFSFRYVCIYTRARAYLQLSISIWQSCRSIGKYCRFIGHDAVIVKLEQTQNINFVS